MSLLACRLALDWSFCLLFPLVGLLWCARSSLVVWCLVVWSLSLRQQKKKNPSVFRGPKSLPNCWLLEYHRLWWRGCREDPTGTCSWTCPCDSGMGFLISIARCVCYCWQLGGAGGNRCFFFFFFPLWDGFGWSDLVGGGLPVAAFPFFFSFYFFPLFPSPGSWFFAPGT